MSRREHDRLHILLGRQPAGQREFCHGDALLSNIIAADRECVLLDWEFAGLYLPGFDLALLWTVLRNTPISPREIEAVISAQGESRREAFVMLMHIARPPRSASRHPKRDLHV